MTCILFLYSGGVVTAITHIWSHPSFVILCIPRYIFVPLGYTSPRCLFLRLLSCAYLSRSPSFYITHCWIFVPVTSHLSTFASCNTSLRFSHPILGMCYISFLSHSLLRAKVHPPYLVDLYTHLYYVYLPSCLLLVGYLVLCCALLLDFISYYFLSPLPYVVRNSPLEILLPLCSFFSWPPTTAFPGLSS